MAARAVYEGVEPYVFWSIVYGKLSKTADGHGEQEVVSLLSIASEHFRPRREPHSILRVEIGFEPLNLGPQHVPDTR